MDEKEVYKKLGENIKKIRKQKGLTQEELAGISGIGLNFMGKIEIAFSKPSLDTIIKISNALDVSLKTLFDSK